MCLCETQYLYNYCFLELKKNTCKIFIDCTTDSSKLQTNYKIKLKIELHMLF